MNNQSRLISTSGRFPNILLAGAVILTLGLGACSPRETATKPAAESGLAGETVGTPEAAAPKTAGAKIYVADGVAIAGADPVAYFSGEVAEGEFVPGSAEYAYEWNGTTWHFSTAENRDKFAANPEQYSPQYGGFCAWAVAQNKTAKIDPAAWRIVDGKLYLNYDKKIQARWQEDVPGNIAKADTNWPTLSAQ